MEKLTLKEPPGIGQLLSYMYRPCTEFTAQVRIGFIQHSSLVNKCDLFISATTVRVINHIIFCLPPIYFHEAKLSKAVPKAVLHTRLFYGELLDDHLLASQTNLACVYNTLCKCRCQIETSLLAKIHCLFSIIFAWFINKSRFVLLLALKRHWEQCCRHFCPLMKQYCWGSSDSRRFMDRIAPSRKQAA